MDLTITPESYAIAQSAPLAAHVPVAGFRRLQLDATGVGHLEFGAMLNGHAVRVLVDTGAATTIIDLDLARRLSLPLTPMVERGGGAGGAEMSLFATNPVRLDQAGASIGPVPVIAMDFTHIRAALAARGVEPPAIILGADFLRAWHAVIDYGTMTLFWKEPEPEAPAHPSDVEPE